MAKYKDKRLNEEISGGGEVEGTAVKSTGETGGTKFLREDGDGTCSWQTPAGSTPTVATGSEVDTGTDNTKMVTPKAMGDSSYTKLALGETSSTAYRGDRGKTAYDHSQTTHAPSDADNTQSVLTASAALAGNEVGDNTVFYMGSGEENTTLTRLTYSDLKSLLRTYFDNYYTPL